MADFVRRLEQVFQVAHSRDRMSSETKEILFGQLQEGLWMELLRGPAVLGALGYKELCVSAKTEERWLAELSKCQGYQRQLKPTSTPKQPPTAVTWEKADQTPGLTRNDITCHNCGKWEHFAWDCWA